MVFEIIRWVTLAILWVCIGLQGWLLIINDRTRKKLRANLAILEDIHAHQKRIMDRAIVWLLENHPEECSDFTTFAMTEEEENNNETN